MENKLMESYLDNIGELVIDENKIVTYKSLSRRFGIHVNTAKQLLHTYLTKEKSRNSFPISATYLIAGKLIDGSFNIAIVNEDDLKKAHSNLVEVTSEHVYSVQKSKNVKELKVLSAVDKELPNLKSSNLVIKCSKCALKSREEVETKSKYVEESKAVIKQALAPEKEPPVPVEVPPATVPVETASNCPKKPSPKGNVKKAEKKPAGNIANLFAKAAEKSAAKAPKLDKTDFKNEETKTNEVKEVESRTENENLESRNGTKESFKKKKTAGSKRKRIQMLSDSEESENDDETVDVEDEGSPPPVMNLEDEKETVDPTPRNKRKKRKVIDKTVMNADGYLETRKEVVFETDSENEPEEVTAPKEQKKPKPEGNKAKGQSAGGPKKQASLLSFFKKS